MKAFIYCACFFGYVMIQVMLKESGIMLGAIPTILLVSVTWKIGRVLCEKWEEYSYQKEREEFQKNYKEPTPPPEVAVAGTKEADTPAETVGEQEKATIKFCRKCGFELLEGSEFCSRCGTAIVKE